MTLILPEHRTTGELLSFLRGALPETVETSNKRDDWRIYGPATVVRCMHMAESICQLGSRFVDSAILTRSLFEHVANFAWVAIDPTTNLARIVAHENRERLKADDEMATLDGGKRLIPPESRARLEAYLRGVQEKRLPRLLKRVEEADAYWSRKLHELKMDGRYSLRGLYVTFFRGMSDYVHPTTVGLYSFVEILAEDRAALVYPAPWAPGTAADTASTLLGFLAFVCSSALGWPDYHQLCGLFERMEPQPE